VPAESEKRSEAPGFEISFAMSGDQTRTIDFNNKYTGLLAGSTGIASQLCVTCLPPY
jgi:hypothetical protein